MGFPWDPWDPWEFPPSAHLYKKPMLCKSNRMHNAVVSKLIAASRGSPCDSMASCVSCMYDTIIVITWLSYSTYCGFEVRTTRSIFIVRWRNVSIYNNEKRNVLVQRLDVGNGITLMEIDAASPMEPWRIAAYTLHFWKPESSLKF